MIKKILTIICLIIMVTIFSGCTGDTQKADCISAYVMSQTFVEKNLKAPSTAEFGMGSSNYKCTELKNNEYIINSHVDSQNGFGAMIRSEYTVFLKYIGEDIWEANTIIIDDKVIYSSKKE